ncbi:hypothetical protein [Aureimonas sp. D3]|uniref:hypothetical protein n=1 Tax=Aureimonas sp. D3 TaxID=1638164 RepID=UPI0007837591|nr:hypothetical protein [Aureimonas sp. D3]
MKIKGRITSIRRQIQAIQDRSLSPQARAKMLADRAERAIEEASAHNRALLGRAVTHRVTVDGREDAPLSSVKPDGVIIANFDLGRDVLEWIGEQLVKASPVLTGAYARSHVLEIDGIEWDGIGPMPKGKVFKFSNRQPYARKMEPRKRVISEVQDAAGNTVRGSRKMRGGRRNWRKRTKTDVGQSDQAPEGVYAVVAAMARERYGDVASISYSVKNFDPDTGLSRPAITVKLY